MCRHVFLLIVAGLCGCAARPSHVQTAADHPANPAAATGLLVTTTEGESADAAPTVVSSVGQEHGASELPAQAPVALYMCPMHPDVTSNDPTARCPRCGMLINKPIIPENPA